MKLRRTLLSSLFATLALGATLASAAGTVELVLVGDTQGSAMLFQEWAELLGKAGIRNLRIRAAEDSDKVGIVNRGTEDHPTYVVTGILRSRDELLLPGRPFHRGDTGQLAKWLNDLAEHGPTSGHESTAAFGLSSAQFQKVHQDLATPVGIATAHLSRQQLMQTIGEKLKLPLKLDAEVVQAIGDDKLKADLADLSCGTALAYVLRSAGYGLVPRGTAGDLHYDVVKAGPELEVWPVGTKSPQPAQETLPTLFEFLNVNVQNVTVADALTAIAKRLKAPVLMDQIALQRHGIDPAGVKATLPRSRTTYSLALRKLLFQARLKFEVRSDEAGTPFLWITSVKP